MKFIQLDPTRVIPADIIQLMVQAAVSPNRPVPSIPAEQVEYHLLRHNGIKAHNMLIDQNHYVTILHGVNPDNGHILAHNKALKTVAVAVSDPITSDDGTIHYNLVFATIILKRKVYNDWFKAGDIPSGHWLTVRINDSTVMSPQMALFDSSLEESLHDGRLKYDVCTDDDPPLYHLFEGGLPVVDETGYLEHTNGRELNVAYGFERDGCPQYQMFLETEKPVEPHELSFFLGRHGNLRGADFILQNIAINVTNGKVLQLVEFTILDKSLNNTPVAPDGLKAVSIDHGELTINRDGPWYESRTEDVEFTFNFD